MYNNMRRFLGIYCVRSNTDIILNTETTYFGEIIHTTNKTLLFCTFYLVFSHIKYVNFKKC